MTVVLSPLWGFRGLSFANKWVLYLIPVVLVLAGLWWYFLSKKNFPSLKLSATNAFAGMSSPFKATLKKFLPVLRVSALIFLLIALARPQTSYDEEKIITLLFEGSSFNRCTEVAIPIPIAVPSSIKPVLICLS